MDPSIEMVVVNLSFAATVAKKSVTLEEAVENIDIGDRMVALQPKITGVTVVVNPARYEAFWRSWRTGAPSARRRVYPGGGPSAMTTMMQ